MTTAIAIERLSKKYLLRHERGPSYATLRDTLAGAAARFSMRASGHGAAARASVEEFWALKDVTFDIQQGDRVGIVGRNGAGKSTLLKVLSRITEPSAGRVSIRGRVASLLEVGTGFHPELTGRENVFLNGAILGMSKGEIRRKFDEIVDFAEVERFLDTPVKRYSSGMYVRLAFAVAAHLEPEILIVDEVLAVGDAQFQKKCLGKMEQIGHEGRTVIFVSHNVQAVRRLCTRAALLQAGSLVAYGPSQQITDLYFQRSSEAGGEAALSERIASFPDDPAFELLDVAVSQQGQPVQGFVHNGQPLEVAVRYRIKQEVRGHRVFIDMQDDQGNVLFRTFHDDDAEGISHQFPGTYVSTATIPANLLAAIPHLLCVKTTIYNVRYTTPEDGVVIPLQVEQSARQNPAYLAGRFVGRIAFPFAWDTRATESAVDERIAAD